MAKLTKNEKYIVDMYVRYFGKTPTKAQIADYADLGKPKLILAQIRGESQDAKEGMSSSEYVNSVFQNLFGRNASTKELNKYSKFVDKGEDLPINAIVKAAKPSDKAVYQTKQAVALFIAEKGSTTNIDLDKITKDTYTNVYDLKAKKVKVDSVEELKTKVDAMKDNVTGETFNLTTGIDSGAAFTGTDKGDVFNASLDRGAETFTSLDSINGGAGKDTLNIVSLGDLTTAAGVTVQNVETVNLTAAAAITKADVSGFTGVETLNITSGGNITGVVASATTGINVANGLAGVTVNGGKDVTITNGTAGNINVGATTAAAGNVTATNNFATGTVTVKGAGTLTATSNDGAITFVNGTSITANAKEAVSLATREANLKAKADANTANTAATTDADASGLAKAEAAAKVIALTQLATDITNATNVSADQTTAVSIGLATTTALNAGAITLAEKAAIDAAFATGLVTSTAAARTAAQNVLTPLQTTATAAKTAADAADAINDANAAAALAAANAVVAADTTKAGLVDGVVVTATTNTALTSATINGNYGSTTNAITDASTLNNTLTTVTLNNAGDTTITGKAIATINVTDADGADVAVVNSTVDNTLALNLNNSDINFINAANTTKTLNVVATGENTLDINAQNVSTLNISGAGDITVTQLTNSIAAAAVINASTATGDITMSVAAGQTYTGGSGVDTITLGTVTQAKAVDGGAGSSDKVVITNATAVGTTAAALVKNFEVVELSDTVNVDLSKLTNSTITSVIVNGTSTITGMNATQAANVKVTTNSTLTLGLTGATVVGQIDVVTLTVDDGLDTVASIALTTPDLAGVETLNIIANEDVTINALTSATALTNVAVTGEGEVSITSGALALNVNSVIDASAVNADVTLNFFAATANGVSLKAGNGDNTLTGTDIVGKGNTIVSGDGDSTINGGQADDIITAGNGNNTIDAKNGANTVKVGNGNNDITTGTGADTITAGNGINVIDAGAGNDIITVGTGYNLITGGAGADTITFGTNAAGMVNGLVYTAASETFAGATITSGTTALTGIDKIYGLGSGDTINLSTILNTFTGATGSTIAAATGTTVSLVKGTLNVDTNIWTTSSTGTDTLFVYDVDGAGAGTNVGAIALIGVVATGTADAGILTIA